MHTPNILHLNIISPIRAQNAGLFVSRGGVTHPTRVIDSHELILVKEGCLEMWEEDHSFRVELNSSLRNSKMTGDLLKIHAIATMAKPVRGYNQLFVHGFLWHVRAASENRMILN